VSKPNPSAALQTPDQTSPSCFGAAFNGGQCPRSASTHGISWAEVHGPFLPPTWRGGAGVRKRLNRFRHVSSLTFARSCEESVDAPVELSPLDGAESGNAGARLPLVGVGGVVSADQVRLLIDEESLG
jgi:hypothetical protein